MINQLLEDPKLTAEKYRKWRSTNNMLVQDIYQQQDVLYLPEENRKEEEMNPPPFIGNSLWAIACAAHDKISPHLSSFSETLNLLYFQVLFFQVLMSFFGKQNNSFFKAFPGIKQNKTNPNQTLLGCTPEKHAAWSREEMELHFRMANFSEDSNWAWNSWKSQKNVHIVDIKYLGWLYPPNLLMKEFY